MRRKLLITTAVALGFVGVSTPAFAHPSESSQLDPTLMAEKLSDLHESANASVLVDVRDGDASWSSALGERDPWTKQATKPTDQVRIASLTKSMVTTVVLQLVEEQKIELDTPIDEYLPGILPYDDPITVRQLLSHTSGIPDYFTEIYPSLLELDPSDLRTNRYDYFTPKQLIDAATRHPLLFEPGTNYSYSNTNYYLIGLAVEKLTGVDLGRQLTSRVFKPAQLTSTYFPKYSPFILGPSPNAYFALPDGDSINTTGLSPSQMWAAGAVVASPRDMNRFFRAMYDGTLLPEHSLAEARDLTEQSENTYGLGTQAIALQCDGVPGGIAYGHTGGGLGHTTYSFHSADGQRQVSFTLAVDPQIVDTGAIAQDMSDLLVAGLCTIDMDDLTSANTTTATDISDQLAALLNDQTMF